jgi:hypothetical protein
MSDREIILQLLRTVEWRIRANRLFYELTLGLSVVLATLIAFKVWDLFSPFQALTVESVLVVLIIGFAAFAIWRFRERGTLEQAAVLIDHKAGLRDEIRTAFWFLNSPRSSVWIEKQIERAAKSARSVDVQRAYPGMIPRTSYIAAATVLLFAGLNFIPTPANHNWLMLQAATPDQVAAKSATAEGFLDTKGILQALKQIAEKLRESELLQPTADDLANGDLQGAANDLRNLADQIAKGEVSADQIQEMKQALALAATSTKKAELEPALQELTDTSDTAEDTGIYEELNETAQVLEELAEKLQTASQEGESYQAGKSSDETPSNESVQVSDSAPGELKRSNSTGPGGGSNAPPGGLAQLPTSLETKLQLDVKLQAQAVETVEANKAQGKPKDEEEISQATKLERSKVDYRNVKSDLSPAQKDLLNQDHVPWEYRALIKGYFQAIRPQSPGPVKK